MQLRSGQVRCMARPSLGRRRLNEGGFQGLFIFFPRNKSRQLIRLGLLRRAKDRALAQTGARTAGGLQRQRRAEGIGLGEGRGGGVQTVGGGRAAWAIQNTRVKK